MKSDSKNIYDVAKDNFNKSWKNASQFTPKY